METSPTLTPLRRWFGLFAVVWVLALTMSAAGTSHAPEDLRRTAIPTAGTTFAPSQRVLVRDDHGVLYLAYLKNVGGIAQVYVARSQDEGSSWTDLPPASTGPTESSNRHLLIDREGRLRLFWTKQVRAGAGEEDHGTDRQIFTSTYGDGRGRWSAQKQLTFREYNGFPSSAVDSRGRVHLVWYGFAGQAYQVMYSVSQDGHWSDALQLSHAFPDSVNPTIVVDGQDHLHVAWYKYTRAARASQVYYRRYDAQEEHWLDQVQLSKDVRNATNVSLAVDARGRVHAVWEGRPALTEFSRLYHRTLDQGAWGPQAAITPPSSQATHPSVAADREGRVYAFYHSGADDQIYLVTRDGERWGRPRRLTDTRDNAYPSARWSLYTPALGASGGVIDYVWTELDADPANPAGAHLIRYGGIPVR